MSHFKNNTSMAVALVLLSLGVIACVVGSGLQNAQWTPRLSFLGIGLIIGAVPVALLSRRQYRNYRLTKRQLDAIAELDPNDINIGMSSNNSPSIPVGNLWESTIDRIRGKMVEHYERVQELEHIHNSLELRCRRVTAKFDKVNSILASLNDPIIAIDDYNELMLANPKAESLFDFDASNPETRALGQLLHCQELVNLLTTTCHRKTVTNRFDEIKISDNDGDSHWYRVTAKALQAGQGDEKDSPPSGAVAVLRDISDQKALQKRNAEFVSAVSHEMKTPLSGIKAYVELLIDGDAEDEETQEEFLNIINSQADRLRRLVDNMLNLARIEAGVVNVKKENRPLNELLEEALNVVQPSAEAKQIKLVNDLSPMYLGVLADRDMLLQSAINLLSNAIKYTPNGGQVTLRSRLADDEVRFEVEDTGVGLTEEDCRRIFDKFYRVKKDSEMASGTGLGLPLAKHIVEDVHSGRLVVHSMLGKGSTFTATLPSSGQLS